MSTQQVIDLIKSKELEHYTDYLELKKAFGPDDKGTKHAAAQWNAVSTILDEIEESINK